MFFFFSIKLLEDVYYRKSGRYRWNYWFPSINEFINVNISLEQQLFINTAILFGPLVETTWQNSRKTSCRHFIRGSSFTTRNRRDEIYADFWNLVIWKRLFDKFNALYILKCFKPFQWNKTTVLLLPVGTWLSFVSHAVSWWTKSNSWNFSCLTGKMFSHLCFLKTCDY